MLKVILYAGESPLGSSPMLYYTKSDNKDILFIEYVFLLQSSIISYKIKSQPRNGLSFKKLTGDTVLWIKIGDDTKSYTFPY
jgi:hypothetical protein